MMRETVLANDGTVELAMGMADEMVGFSCFGDSARAELKPCAG